MPGPSNSHRRRSPGEPSANRGYHASGTDTTRPSRNSTTSARSVTRTFLAAAVSVATMEVLMPCLRELGLVFLNDGRYTVQFRLAESVIVRHSNGRQPELGEFTVPFDVNMRRLVLVAGEKEKSIRAAPQDGRTHRRRFSQLFALAAMVMSDPANDQVSAAAAHDRSSRRRLQTFVSQPEGFWVQASSYRVRGRDNTGAQLPNCVRSANSHATATIP